MEFGDEGGEQDVGYDYEYACTLHMGVHGYKCMYTVLVCLMKRNVIIRISMCFYPF